MVSIKDAPTVGYFLWEINGGTGIFGAVHFNRHAGQVKRSERRSGIQRNC
jgi:hypothetical protein